MNKRSERAFAIALYDCQKDLKLKKEECEKVGEELCKILKVRGVKSSYFKHNGGGVSYNLIIEESFIHISTWPEYGTLICYIASCNPESSPWEAKNYLESYFCPKEARIVYDISIPLSLYENNKERIFKLLRQVFADK